jgi:hypothetical protein
MRISSLRQRKRERRIAFSSNSRRRQLSTHFRKNSVCFQQIPFFLFFMSCSIFHRWCYLIQIHCFYFWPAGCCTFFLLLMLLLLRFSYSSSSSFRFIARLCGSRFSLFSALVNFVAFVNSFTSSCGLLLFPI